MTDFAQHIQDGIRAATTAEGHRAEIRGILDELDRAIRIASLGTACLHVGEFRNDEDEKLMRIGKLRERLVIRSVDDERRGRIIAGWDMDLNDGFSVSLVYNFMDLPCGSGDQLIEELGALMQSARVGRVIQEFQRGTA
ncbi:MAG: hypothetical protein EOP37_04145 [Rubrivivax sp.]|nr:MAG: hypothetical protein EOP37_04145 [Rubrivivax sp.]